ncbi:hypothetical protein LTR49_025140 [Elasticomyces elasticus]|nr:hypothetical protein LTR49_025140 [Elasticomyces elasticus]
MSSGQGSMPSRHQEKPSQLSPRYDPSLGQSGHYATFPTGGHPRHLSQTSHGKPAFNSAHTRQEPLWQQPQPLRLSSYSQVDHALGNPQSYQSAFWSPQQPPLQKLQYPPASIDVQNATSLHDNRGLHPASVGAYQPYGQTHPFTFLQPHSSIENAFVPHQAYTTVGCQALITDPWLKTIASTKMANKRQADEL